MISNYLLNLYKQYHNARGITYNQREIEQLSYDFLEWIAINKLLTQEYWNYLSYLGYVNCKTIAEIDKGRYDSIISDNITIISSYANTMQLPKKRLLIVKGMPLIESNNKLSLMQQEVLLTYNPYLSITIDSWPSVHNLGEYDISIGMFGSIYDKDIDSKLKVIEEIAKKMQDDYKVDYDTDKDKYFCSLNSKRKVKIKTLVR